MDILIRKVPDDIYAALKEKAHASKEGALEPWLKEQLTLLAQGPIVKECYRIRIGGIGQIRRFGDQLTSTTHEKVSEQKIQIIEQAANLVRRNGPGDREEAMYLLRSHFNDVYET